MCRLAVSALALCLLVLLPGVSTASAHSGLWTQEETVLWAGTLAATAGVSLVDDDIRSFFQKNRGEPADSAAEVFSAAGHVLTTLAVGGGLYAYGWAYDDAYAAETGKIAVQAILGSQVAVFALKVAVGRERPDSGDAHSYTPFSLKDDNNSFPSSHTASAFALASVLSRRSSHPWVPWTCYGLASAVGVSRLVRDEHWASDIVVGALIGETAGRMALRWNGRGGEGDPLSIGVVPVHGGGLLAVSGWW